MFKAYDIIIITYYYISKSLSFYKMKNTQKTYCENKTNFYLLCFFSFSQFSPGKIQFHLSSCIKMKFLFFSLHKTENFLSLSLEIFTLLMNIQKIEENDENLKDFSLLRKLIFFLFKFFC